MEELDGATSLCAQGRWILSRDEEWLSSFLVAAQQNEVQSPAAENLSARNTDKPFSAANTCLSPKTLLGYFMTSISKPTLFASSPTFSRQMMASISLPQDIPQLSSEYPAKVRQSAGLVNGVATDVTLLTFTDKIMITTSQGGRLAQWVRA